MYRLCKKFDVHIPCIVYMCPPTVNVPYAYTPYIYSSSYIDIYLHRSYVTSAFCKVTSIDMYTPLLSHVNSRSSISIPLCYQIYAYPSPYSILLCYRIHAHPHPYPSAIKLTPIHIHPRPQTSPGGSVPSVGYRPGAPGACVSLPDRMRVTSGSGQAMDSPDV